MSGSGGSYLAPSTPASSCATLQFDTQLASPKASVVANISVNDLLDIALSQSSNQQIVVALFKGTEAGGIVDPNLSQLRNCMSKGELYQAKVLQISGGQVRLRISHV
jgi:hypothetical protein